MTRPCQRFELSGDQVSQLGFGRSDDFAVGDCVADPLDDQCRKEAALGVGAGAKSVFDDVGNHVELPLLAFEANRLRRRRADHRVGRSCQVTGFGRTDERITHLDRQRHELTYSIEAEKMPGSLLDDLQAYAEAGRDSNATPTAPAEVHAKR